MHNHQHQQKQRLTAEDYEVRIWGFVVIVVTLILAGIVFSLLYSVTFVTQPIKSMAPIDMAYTKMLNDIVLLVVGGIGGVMSRKGVGALASTMAGSTPVTNNTAPVVAAPVVQASGSQPLGNFNWMGFTNPTLDETWTPPPPPTTPPDHVEPDTDRQLLALARKEAT